MTAMSKDFDVEVQRQTEKLKHGGCMQIGEALGYYQRVFVPVLTSSPLLIDKMIGLSGFWCEAFIRALKNDHISPAYREHVLQILANDFPIQMFEAEVRSYYIGASPADRLAMLHMLGDEKTPERLRSIIESLRLMQ